MLISMPTGTSTIFGVFQAIPSSHVFCHVIWQVSDKQFGANSAPTPT
jgi:hypothetical protein